MRILGALRHTQHQWNKVVQGFMGQALWTKEETQVSTVLKRLTDSKSRNIRASPNQRTTEKD